MLAGNVTEDMLRTTLEPMFGVQEPGFGAHRARRSASSRSAARRRDAPLHGRVLLVEDNPVNQRVAQRLLDLHGLDVTAVSDGRQAVERLEREPFDLVLMDCLMPVMDGYMATRLWRERERTTGERASADRRDDRERDGRRSRALPRGRHGRLHLQAARSRRAGAAAARNGCAISQADAPPATNIVRAAFAAPPAAVPATPAAPQCAARASVTGERLRSMPSIIGDLLDTMGGEFGDLVRVYLEDAPQRMREIEAAAANGDAAAQVAPAHTLKSSSANIGATALSELARGIEHAARAGVPTGPAEIAAGIRPEYERVAAELSRLLEKQ